MTVRVYRSDDSSAPTLNGTVGSLITVLDAILVNGYGAKTAAGWAKEFSGTNLAAYRAASGNRFRLRVDDTAAQEARIVGYVSMSDVNTGTEPFPTSSQVSGGLFVRKSNTADSTARPWIAIATGTALYFLPFSDVTSLASGGAATSGTSGHTFFGDFVSYKPGDAYNCLIASAAVTSTSASTLGAVAASFSGGTVTTGHYVPRAYTQSGTSVQVAKGVLGLYQTAAVLGPASGLPAYPDVIAGGIPLGPIEILEPSSILLARGRLPGMWGPQVVAPGAHLDTFTGSGELSGKTFTLVNVAATTSAGRTAFETSDTW